MDLVKTKYKQKKYVTEYFNTNIHKTTTNTTQYMKYMKQVWNKVRIESTVNVCF